jgi:hypothetical protein
MRLGSQRGTMGRKQRRGKISLPLCPPIQRYVQMACVYRRIHTPHMTVVTIERNIDSSQ